MDVSHLQSIALFLLMNIVVGWTAVRAVSLLWGGLSPFARWAAVAVVYCGEIIVVEAVLGFMGFLTVAAVAVAVSAILCILIFVRAKPRAKDGGGERWGGPAAVFAAALFCVFLCMAIWAVVTPPPAGGDGFIYHLYFPAVWLRHGAIEYVPLPYGAQAATYYPMNTESLILWLMLPFHEDFLANAVQLPFLLLCGALVAALAVRVMGVGGRAAVVAAVATMLFPAAIQQSVVARVDVAFSAWFLASLLFLVEWNRRRGARYAALAGAAFGLFVGTKSIGLLFGFLILLPFLWMLRRETLKSAVAAVLLFGIAAFAFGGFWYARNWVATGNPVYPLHVSVGGATVFAGAYGREAMRVFHVSDPKEILRIFDFFLGKGIGILFPAAAVGGLVLMFVKREYSAGKLYLLLLPFLLLGLFWWANPHNNLTNGRFLFPAFFLFGVAVAYALDAMGKAGWLLGVIVAAAVSWSTVQHDDLARIVREVATTLAGTNEGLLSPARAAVALLAASGGAVGLWLLFRRGWAGKICLAAGLLLLFPALNSTWEYYEAYKYRWYGAFPQGRAWAVVEEQVARRQRVGGPARIANCGGERAYGLFGTGLRNEVFSVNVDSRAGWQFHDYHLRIPANRRAPAGSERPQFHRASPDAKAWLDNLEARRVDILFCAALDPIARRHMAHDRDGFTIEVSWAERDPGRFRELYRNEEVRIYRFLGGGAGEPVHK
ncbi:MAG: hypothetical protein ABIH66_13290 [bacterium]